MVEHRMAKKKSIEPGIPAATVAEYIASMRSQFGEDAAFVLDESQINPQQYTVDVIPSGLPALDTALGIGGLPRGRIVEIYGPEMCGKTSLAIQIAASYHRTFPGIVQFVDAEHALDTTYASRVGVDMSRLVVSQPSSGEHALRIVEHAVTAGAGVVIVDSVAALVPQAELDGDIGEFQMGLHARLMSQAMRRITGVAHRHNALVIFINQVRMKIGIVYGNPETTTGGQALKFYSSVRMEIRRGKHIGPAEEPHGQEVTIKIVKNKCAPPFRTVTAHLLFGVGFDVTRSLLDAAIASGIVAQSGSWIEYGGQRWHGAAAFADTVRNDAALREALSTELLNRK